MHDVMQRTESFKERVVAMAALALLVACGSPGDSCPPADEAPTGQLEATLPAWQRSGAPDVSRCSTCQAATLNLPAGARGTRFVAGAGGAEALAIDVTLALGQSASRAPSRLAAIVDGAPVGGASIDVPFLAGGSRWSGSLALPVAGLGAGSHQVAVVSLEDSLDDPYPTASLEVVKGASSALHRPALAETRVVDRTASFGNGVFPTDALRASGLPNRPLSALSTPLSLPDANGDATLRLLFSAVSTNCPKPEDRFRVLAFLDKEPLKLRGESSLDVVVPKGKQAELELTLHGLPTSGRHSLEFWSIPAPDRHVVDDIASDVPNVWLDFIERHSIVFWNAPATAARVIPARPHASTCARATDSR